GGRARRQRSRRRRMRTLAVSRQTNHETGDEPWIHGLSRRKGEKLFLEAGQAELEETLGVGNHTEEPVAQGDFQPARRRVERGEAQIAEIAGRNRLQRGRSAERDMSERCQQHRADAKIVSLSRTEGDQLPRRLSYKALAGVGERSDVVESRPHA